MGIVAIQGNIDTSGGRTAAKCFRRSLLAQGAYQVDLASERIKLGPEWARADGKVHGGHACCDPGGHTAPALESLYQRAARYRVGLGGVEFLTGGAPTVDIIEYPDGSMAFNPTAGWGKDGLAYSIRSALDREHARRFAGWDAAPDAIKKPP